MTTDGSITDIPREDYIEAEERVVSELKELHKPFVIVLNSDDPYSDYTKKLAARLEEKYSVSVIPTDCSNLSINDINDMFGKLLYEFPIEQMNITLPRWVDALDEEHWLKKELYSQIKTAFTNISVLKQVDESISSIRSTEIISNTSLNEINLGNGNVNVNILLNEPLFYQILTEMTGVNV